MTQQQRIIPSSIGVEPFERQLLAPHHLSKEDLYDVTTLEEYRSFQTAGSLWELSLP